MTTYDQPVTVRTPSIPRPRITEDVPDVPDVVATKPAPPRSGGEFPWPEPWHYSRGARPRSEYWDVETASWHSRGPIAAPRSAD